MSRGRWLRYGFGLALVAALVVGGGVAGAARPGNHPGGGPPGPPHGGPPHGEPGHGGPPHGERPMPKKPPRAEQGQRAWIEAQVRRMSLEEKVGQMFTTYAYGESADTEAPEDVEANRDLHGVDNFEQLIEKYHLGGAIYFAWSNNVNDSEQIAGLSNGVQRASIGQKNRLPMLVSTDQEQGVVVRVDDPATQFPGNMALGASRSAKDARVAARITGEELRAVGINHNNAPDADVNSNPRNPVIGVRSFGSEPDLVSEMAAAQVRGYQEGANIAATAKHFPGHGDTDVDSHYGLPIIEKSRAELEREDFPPFEAAIDEDVDAVMSAHIVVPALDDSGLPATLSEPILTGVLREEMGYDGLIVTDALDMDAVSEEIGAEQVPVRAVKVGVDMMLMPPDLDLAYNAVLDAVRSGEIPERRIDESVKRILALKIERGLFDDPYVDVDEVSETVGVEEHRTAADEIADGTITLVKNDADALPLESGAGREVLVTGAGGISSGAADSQDASTLGSLASAIEERGDATEIYESGASPDAATREEAVSRAEDSDLVVVTTNNAWDSEEQQALVEELRESGTPVVVAAVRDPYDIAHSPDAETYVATYSYRPVSMRALVRAMYGEVEPSGRLPVEIPEADDPDAMLFPFGHALGYGE